MSKGLYIEVVDHITGYCPACRSPRIELAYMTGGGTNSKYEVQKYALRCEHQDVCKLRHDYMGAGDCE